MEIPSRKQLHLEVIANKRKGMDPLEAVRAVLKKYSLRRFPDAEPASEPTVSSPTHDPSDSTVH